MKIKLTKNRIIFLVVLILISSFLVFNVYFYRSKLRTWNYYGKILIFRADLREANKIPVYPNESSIYNLFLNPEIKNITIVFKPVEGAYGFYSVQAFEIVNKLSIFYLHHGIVPLTENITEVPACIKFSAISSESFENLEVSPFDIVIVLNPFSDENAIRVKGNLIFLNGKNFEEFDLVAVKLLMVVFEIKL